MRKIAVSVIVMVLLVSACGGSSDSSVGESSPANSGDSSEGLGSCDLIDFDALSERFGLELSVDNGIDRVPIPDSFPVSPSRSCTAYDAEGGAMFYIEVVPASWEKEYYSVLGKEEEYSPVDGSENIFFASEPNGLGFLSGKLVKGEYEFHIAGRLRDKEADDGSFGSGFKPANRDDLVDAISQIADDLVSYKVPEADGLVDCDAEVYKKVASTVSVEVEEIAFWGAPVCVAIAENGGRLHAMVSERDDAAQFLGEIVEYYDSTSSRPVPESVTSDSFDALYFIEKVQVAPLADTSKVINEMYAISGGKLVYVSAMGDEAVAFYDATQLEEVAKQALAS